MKVVERLGGVNTDKDDRPYEDVRITRSRVVDV